MQQYVLRTTFFSGKAQLPALTHHSMTIYRTTRREGGRERGQLPSSPQQTDRSRFIPDPARLCQSSTKVYFGRGSHKIGVFGGENEIDDAQARFVWPKITALTRLAVLPWDHLVNHGPKPNQSQYNSLSLPHACD